MYRVIFFLMTLAVAIGMVTGCTIQTPAPTVTVTAPAPTQAAPAPAPQADTTDSDFMAYLISQDSAYAAVPVSVAVETAKNLCTSLRNGGRVADIAAGGQASGLTANQIAAIVVGAVKFYCPDQESNVRTQVSGYSA